MKRVALALLLAGCSTTPEPPPHIVVGTSTTSTPEVLPPITAPPTTRRTPTTRASRSRVVTPTPSRPGVTGDVWARLRQCESGGNYANKSNPRYRGAYQFSFATWQAVGGSGDPADAPPAEQDMRAQRLASIANPYTQWPVCWARAVR